MADWTELHPTIIIFVPVRPLSAPDLTCHDSIAGLTTSELEVLAQVFPEAVNNLCTRLYFQALTIGKGMGYNLDVFRANPNLLAFLHRTMPLRSSTAQAS